MIEGELKELHFREERNLKIRMADKQSRIVPKDASGGKNPYLPAPGGKATPPRR
jgi:hypothetical protein